MDSIKTQKLQAVKNYTKAQFLYNLTVYSLTAFLSCLFYSYLFWFPSLKQHFFTIFIPNIYSFFLSPKLLFVVGNVIVLFLVGESKLLGRGSSPATEIYNEYVRRSQSLRPQRSWQVDEYKKLEMQMDIKRSTRINEKSTSVHHNKDDEKKKEIEEQTSHNNREAVCKVDSVEEKLHGEGEEEEEEEKIVVLARDELNRRVEEFIARVNKQRRLEERQVLDH
ncbi:hypothetical protein ACH5RR_035439 [Cinchona calisaya]|uniref:DUF4408 domain-containing protein n=1 Tax=Cinchona calisaya TaxID=153742 RepID=A0ABD2Y2K5_9GENT